jgi:hypothetical protein
VTEDGGWAPVRPLGRVGDAGAVGNGLVGAPFDDALAVANAVLYEGYALYPYRRSSAKNRVRFQFGVVMPRSCIDTSGAGWGAAPTVAGSAESWYQQTEALFEPGSGGTVAVRVRFLRLEQRQVDRRCASGWEPVERLETGGNVHVPFDEGVEEEVELGFSYDSNGVGTAETMATLPASDAVQEIVSGGEVVGRILRRRESLTLHVQTAARPVQAPFRLSRLRLRVENTTGWNDAGVLRDQVLRRSALATHALVAASGARFLSLLDPPDWATPAVAACENHYTYPVLAGRPGRHDLILSSPIILYDHPRVAPESPGDLFDATEIDEILSLRTLTLTDEEKAEIRVADARTAAIVDRVDTMPPEVLARLHGVVRTMTELSGSPTPKADEVVLGDGERAGAGDLVILHPRDGGADAGDMFLRGRTGRIEAIIDDVDDRCHVAVTVPDAPGAEIQQWYGRYYYFSPEELSVARNGRGPEHEVPS